MLIYIQDSSPTTWAALVRSLVGNNVAWKADGRGFESHLRQPFFLYCIGRVVLCCFAFLLCCCCVALPFSASLQVIVHVHCAV